MNYFNMTYEQVLNSPMQRLLLLARSIPKYEPKQDKKEKKKPSILDFAKQNNLLKK